MKLLTFLIIAVSIILVTTTVFPQATATLPDGTEITIGTNADITAETVQKLFKTGVFLYGAFKAGPAKWDIGMYVIVGAAIIFIVLTLMIIIITRTPTKVDDAWLRGKFLPFFVRWMQPLVRFVLNFNKNK
jgi:hypothetical protein